MRQLKYSPQSNEEFDCTIVHKLTQPLTTISAYLWGCIYRLSNGNPEKEVILRILSGLLQDIDYAQQILQQINDCVNKVETTALQPKRK